MLPDLSEALGVGSVNLPGCVPAVEDEEGGAAGAFSLMLYKQKPKQEINK